MTEGFIVEDLIDGILSNEKFTFSSDSTNNGSWYFALSIMGYEVDEANELLFKAKILPYQNTLCLKNIISDNIKNIFIGDCINVELLYNENIIAIFGGGAESGRRALGNRSIIADPRNPKMKDKTQKAAFYCL